MPRGQDDENDSPYVFCEMCQQMSERGLVQECPYCFKHFCRSCAVRSGNMAYCSKACASAWFFADADEDDEEEGG